MTDKRLGLGGWLPLTPPDPNKPMFNEPKKTFQQIRADLEWEGTVLALRVWAWTVFLLYVVAGPACIALGIAADWLAIPWTAGLVYFWVYIREDLPSWEASK